MGVAPNLIYDWLLPKRRGGARVVAASAPTDTVPTTGLRWRIWVVALGCVAMSHVVGAAPLTGQEKVLPCYRTPNTWVLVFLPGNSAVPVVKNMARQIGMPWKQVGEAFVSTNGKGFLRAAGYKHYLVPPTVANAVRRFFQSAVVANNSRANCLVSQRAARVMVMPSTMTLEQFLSLMRLQPQNVVYQEVIRDLQLLNPHLQLQQASSRLASGAMVLIPQNIPINPEVLEKLFREYKAKQQVAQLSKGGWSFSFFGGPKITRIYGLDTESGGRARAISNLETSAIAGLSYDLDSSPRYIGLRAQVAFESFSYRSKDSNQSSVSNNIPSDALFSELELRWISLDQSLLFGLMASYVPFIAFRLDSDGSDSLNYLTANAFGPVFGTIKHTPYPWSLSALVKLLGFIGETNLDLEPGFELQLGATNYYSDSTNLNFRLRITNIRASEPRFGHDQLTFALEFGVELY